MKQKSFTKLDGYKHVIKKSELNGFSLTEGIYPPKFRQSCHTHEIAHISLILSGGYTERQKKQTWDSRTAVLALRPVGLTHSVDFDDVETRIFTIEVKSRWFDYVGEKPEVLNRPANFSGSSPVFFATRLYGEYRRGDWASTLAMEGLVLEMIAAASNESTTGRERGKSRWLKQARDFLHAEFAGNPTIEEVARIAGVHPTHLARVFREQMGCTIGEYIRRLRIVSASQKLASTDASLGEIAMAVGFADQSHLSRTFQTYLGVPPGEYRKFKRLR